MENRLAIIIPAYKSTFLGDTIKSITNQTSHNFTLYIGDDGSPFPIKDIVDVYKDSINIIYRRFEDNIGKTDLVSHWERCVKMTNNEPYIWLFSDDDIMEPDCVERFYEHLALTKSSYDIYHFNVKVIDEMNEVVRTPPFYPQNLDSFTYYKMKMMARLSSLVVENIFSRDIYDQCNGFQNFDLAWGSDTATWVKFSSRKGFYTINDSFVLWRSSSQNISPDLSLPIVKRKVNALLDFFEWSHSFFKQKNQNCTWYNIRAFISRMKLFHKYMDNDSLKNAVWRFCSIHGCEVVRYPLYKLISIR